MKNDTISRRAAADVVDFECGEWRGLAKTIISQLEALPSAQPERNGWVHIDDIYRLISGHSNYHGDNILAALTCLAEGKEVLKPITVLDTQPEIDEWCHECKEFDTKNDCCPRFNRVIRDALKGRR